MNSFIVFFFLLSALSPLINADLWMHVNVKKIERKQCIIDDASWGAEALGCSQLSYMTLDERILPNLERRSTSFEHIEGANRPTVTHWSRGKLEDWMVAIQFISIDPVYGIARTCDRSGFVRVFEHIADTNVNFKETTLKIQGQCFTATVHVQASSEICPWCLEESKPDALAAPTTTTTESPLSASPPALLITMVCLTIICVVALIGTGVLLILYISERKSNVLPTTYRSALPTPIPEEETLRRLKASYPNSNTTWTTKNSSELSWAEYQAENWQSYHPSLRVTEYQDIKEIHCQSPDSGNGSV